MSNESMLIRQHQMDRSVRPAPDAVMTTDNAPITPPINLYSERLSPELASSQIVMPAPSCWKSASALYAWHVA